MSFYHDNLEISISKRLTMSIIAKCHCFQTTYSYISFSLKYHTTSSSLRPEVDCSSLVWTMTAELVPSWDLTRSKSVIPGSCAHGSLGDLQCP